MKSLLIEFLAYATIVILLMYGFRFGLSCVAK